MADIGKEALSKDHYVTWVFRGLLGLGVTLIGFGITTMVGDLKTTYSTVIEQKEAIRYIVNVQTETRARMDQLSQQLENMRERMRALESRSKYERGGWQSFQYGDENQ